MIKIDEIYVCDWYYTTYDYMNKYNIMIMQWLINIEYWIIA